MPSPAHNLTQRMVGKSRKMSPRRTECRLTHPLHGTATTPPRAASGRNIQSQRQTPPGPPCPGLRYCAPSGHGATPSSPRTQGGVGPQHPIAAPNPSRPALPWAPLLCPFGARRHASPARPRPKTSNRNTTRHPGPPPRPASGRNIQLQHPTPAGPPCPGLRCCAPSGHGATPSSPLTSHLSLLPPYDRLARP
jgi:hypothetical protein